MNLTKIQNLTIHNITGIRSNKIIFQNINFSLEKGSLFIIQGSNGSGKTTLLKIISGLLPKSQGDIIINNNFISENYLKDSLFYMDSTPSFKEDITLLDYLIYWNTLYNGLQNISYEYIRTSLFQLGLSHLQNKKISTLSLGQKKRLLISKLLLTNKQLWILDEPLIGLDKYWIKIFSTILLKHCKRGGIIIMSTHTDLNIKKNTFLILNTTNKFIQTLNNLI
uniref:Cytochrome c biogenesis ATP-binding export protein CcmA n=1 Tax=Reclinomonas americana TaxID=48483 RepID=CCMA_RECAM|nr:ABC transporter ATP-binding subunit [Reclinomonas americana]O21280.1 RecName: Full=Cytochrome c biogenesis ATP-binding export protein CcmA; AltName: Full=Heme exporter protein A [Reclinomonas americana]AAD11907.1 ABC transporter ATP-binding subunit [Reclinomonas americana]